MATKREIRAIPAFFIRQPESVTALVGDTVSFSVQVGGTPPFAYRWRKGSFTIVPYAQGSSTLTITNVQLTNADNFYSCVVSNVGAPNGVLSADKDARVVVYCLKAPGARSLLAAQTLGQMGYSNVRCMRGGLEEWRAEGLPGE